MVCLKIYRKGDNVASVKNNEKKGKKSIDKIKKNNKKCEGKENVKVYEKYTCFAVGLIILLLVFAVIKNLIFIPALLITIALELFCIAYYLLEDKSKKSIVYALFEIGVALVVGAIIYTIFKIV